MTNLQKVMMASTDSSDTKSSMDLSCENGLDLIARELMKKHGDLSLDEGCVVAYAYIHKDDAQKTFFGTSQTVPAGYFDSTSRHEIFDQLSLPNICESLANRHYLEEYPLEEHHSKKGMYRISKEVASECEEIASRLYGVKK